MELVLCKAKIFCPDGDLKYLLEFTALVAS